MEDYLKDKIVITVSSRALFDLEDSDRVFRESGVREFEKYQIAHEDQKLDKGPSFGLIEKLLDIKYKDTNESAFEVVLVSRNNANTGLRIFNSIEAYGLNITRACFTSGKNVFPYLASFSSALFLSFDENDVQDALSHGYAAAVMMKGGDDLQNDQELRIAFDGDSVIFSDEAERIFQERGLEAFKESEHEHSDIPLSPGPFKSFLEGINRIQKRLGENQTQIRTALITARNAPSHKRAIKTLRSWGVTIDEAFFLGGLSKVPVLKGFRPHIFFDDSISYCLPASEFVATGHVAHGIKNDKRG